MTRLSRISCRCFLLVITLLTVIGISACGNSSTSVTASAAFNGSQETIWYLSPYPAGYNVPIDMVLVFQNHMVTCYDTTLPSSQSQLTFGTIQNLSHSEIINKAIETNKAHFHNTVQSDIRLYQMSLQQAQSDMTASHESLNYSDSSQNDTARDVELKNAQILSHDDQLVIDNLSRTAYQLPKAMTYQLSSVSTTNGVSAQTLDFSYYDAASTLLAPTDSCVWQDSCQTVSTMPNPYQTVTFKGQISTNPGYNKVNNTTYSGYALVQGSTTTYLETASHHHFVLDSAQ
ncbi:MAG: hypothetical protein IJV53_01365 [Aeriscardovia sp.]|nr:hypothetical protein [Aeriscardovia sp.]